MQPLLHHAVDAADDVETDTIPFTVNVVVEDNDGSSANTSFTVMVDDDTPVSGIFNELTVTYNPLDPPQQGDPLLSDSDVNALFSAGADGLGGISITGPDLGPDFTYSQEGNTLFGQAGGEDIFSLTVNPDGTYSFELLAPTAGENETQELSGAPDAGSPTTGLTFGDWFVDAPLDLGFSIDNTEVNPSTAGLSGDGNDFKVGEMLRFEYTPGDDTDAFDPTAGDPDSLNFGLKAPQGATFTVYFYLGSNLVGDPLEGVSGTQADGLNLDIASVAGPFDTIILEPTEAPSALKITSISSVDLYAPVDETITFNVSLTDGDGDVVTADIDVTIDQQVQEGAIASTTTQLFTTSNSGSGGKEAPVDTSQGDTLIATGDDDVFEFTLAEHGGDGTDVTISGFGESGSDSLDLRDLLVGEDAEGADLTSYLNVTFDGANTVIEVSSSGAFKGNASDANLVDQTITLEGVDLVGTDELSTVIQNMLDSGQLTTD
ncbi:type I secretion C-terminal target domain-containing protein [Seongchinamella unica]|uniref:Type I secretion C-terminal target domain-containing protein n=1 Tax=Seongchinamella unica TaxID=2547392 RepID=A0A4R5LV44_9GAMM|nr:type I secretion C-terminal target domain-containing protein [Seongchinamella unica]